MVPTRDEHEHVSRCRFGVPRRRVTARDCATATCHFRKKSSVVSRSLTRGFECLLAWLWLARWNSELGHLDSKCLNRAPGKFPVVAVNPLTVFGLGIDFRPMACVQWLVCRYGV